jgi:hypothetical protein
MRVHARMTSPLVAVLVLVGSGACRPAPAIDEPSHDPNHDPTGPAVAVVEAEPVAREYESIAGAMLLYVDPIESAAFVSLDPMEAGARVVEVLERRGSWARVRSLTPREAVALGFADSSGLRLVELDGWVAAGRLGAVDAHATVGAGSSAPAPSTDPGPPARMTVPGGATLYWPDGRVAGRASQQQFFHAEPSVLAVETSQGRLELRCHDRRAAPGLGVIAGTLCSAAADVSEELTPQPSGVALDDPPRMVAELPTDPSAPQGSLDRDIIRRVVRAHLHEVRNCYNEGLKRDPNLRGRVVIDFVIGPDGFVSSAVVEQSDLPDKQVAPCIAAAAGGWQFPKPVGGGNVVVTYPFVLEPG